MIASLGGAWCWSFRYHSRNVNIAFFMHHCHTCDPRTSVSRCGRVDCDTAFCGLLYHHSFPSKILTFHSRTAKAEMTWKSPIILSPAPLWRCLSLIDSARSSHPKHPYADSSEPNTQATSSSHFHRRFVYSKFKDQFRYFRHATFLTRTLNHYIRDSVI